MCRLFRSVVGLCLLASLPILLWACSSAAPTQDQSIGEADKPEGKSQVCRSQIEDYVRENFQQTVTRIDFDYVFDQRSLGEGGGGPTSAAIAYAEECPGYHVFDVFGSDFDCEASVHYGEVRNYVRYRVSEGGC